MIDPLVIRTLFGALGIVTLGSSVAVGCVIFNNGSKKEVTPQIKKEKEEPAPVLTQAQKNTAFISSLFRKNGGKNKKLLIENGSDKDGERAGDYYKKNNDFEDDSNPLNIPDYQKKRSESGVPSEFRDACGKASTSSVSGFRDLTYLNVFMWCTYER